MVGLFDNVAVTLKKHGLPIIFELNIFIFIKDFKIWWKYPYSGGFTIRHARRGATPLAEISNINDGFCVERIES
jgi:hypothetical protein